MWWFFGGLIVGGCIGFAFACILAAGNENEQEERLQAYKQGYRDAMRKIRGVK